MDDPFWGVRRHDFAFSVNLDASLICDAAVTLLHKRKENRVSPTLTRRLALLAQPEHHALLGGLRGIERETLRVDATAICPRPIRWRWARP
jgi:hypothetical protein